MQIEHLNKETTDGTVRNLDALYQLFPSCFTEAQDAVSGDMRRVVDWGKLRELLGEYVEDGEPEKYDFTWVGKRAAQREAAAPCRKTLRPCPEESVDWDTTQNLYIEGDNLEVLKLLQNSYMGKVKMIYIDPPYNTGNDFVYHDDFAQSAEEYDEHNLDDEGNRFRKNTDSNGRFHSDWCSMIYARLMVARSLLTEDGVIFISIDDHEVDNLKKISNEIFGADNFVSQLVWQQGRKSAGKTIATNHEYCLVIAKALSVINDINSDTLLYWKKKKDGLNILYEEETRLHNKYGNNYELINRDYKTFLRNLNEDNPAYNHKHYKCIDEKGIYFPADASAPDNPESRCHKPLIHPLTGRPCNVPRLGWRYKEETLNEMYKKGLFHFGMDEKTIPCVKRYLKDTEYEVAQSVFYKDGRGASNRLSTLFGKKIFDFPKDEEIIEEFTKYVCKDYIDSIILDFFSGSATTAHAVMQLNAEDGGKRKFIMVQLPEETAEDSEAYKAGYKNICEIGKERIRRAGKKIKADSPLTTQDLDIGFRVLKCDESNYKSVAFAPKDYTQESLDMFLDNIKEERTGLDLLFDCMMRWGLELSLPYETQKVDGCTIYNVDDGNLVACFDGVVTSAVIDAIAETHPLRVVFRDSSFTEAAQKMNLFELFKQKCGWTDQEVQNNVRVI